MTQISRPQRLADADRLHLQGDVRIGYGEALIESPSTSVTPSVVAAPRAREERLIDGWCLYSCACPRRAAPGHNFCDRHRTKVQARQSKAKRSTRRALAESGKCIRCRKPSTTYRCSGCRIKDGCTLPTQSVTPSVVADEWRRDNDGWERYRGKGQRGAPSAALTDEQDLAKAVASLERGRVSLAYAHSAAVKEVGRDAQREARAAAASILAMAARQLAEVAERNMPADPRVVGRRALVREALGEGVDPEMIDDAMIDRVILAARMRDPSSSNDEQKRKNTAALVRPTVESLSR